MYDRVINLKSRNPNLKVLLSIGGWDAGSDLFSDMAAAQGRRARFIQNAVTYLRRWRFDGLDLDWEYPGSRGGRASDKQQFTLLLEELKQAFEKDAHTTGRPRLLLSAAVPATSPFLEKGYEVAAVSSALDYVCLMAYDFYGPWDGVARHMTSLFPPEGATGVRLKHTVNYAVGHWLDGGCPRSKLVLGLAAYGRSFTLEDRWNTPPESATTGPGKPGPHTGEDGTLSFYEICSLVNIGADVKWIGQEKVPYLVYRDQWVGYENLHSLSYKTEYIRDQRLGGAMVWDISLDDFSGDFCSHGRFPLLTSINNGLQER